MDKGNKNRVTGATLMNKDSSRSHSIFTILTEMCTRSELDGQEHIRAGKLNLVDLAGSERQSKTRKYQVFMSYSINPTVTAKNFATFSEIGG